MSSLENALRIIDWDFPNSDSSGSINSIHPYPAKFISEIPEKLIEIIGMPKDTWILDPFCGSGTTLVESQIAGIPSIGIDLNPIACLLTQVKTQPLSESFIDWVRYVIKNAKASRNSSVPNIPHLDHWFKKDISEIISKLSVEINLVPDIDIRNALNISLSSILVRISNQESDTRYAAIDKKMDIEKIYCLFLESAERLYLAKANYKPKTNVANVICKDILQVKPTEIDHPVGLVITSPPYPNAYEYWLYHKYRMYWLGFDPIVVKQKEIGARAHFFKKEHHTKKDFQYQMQTVLNLLNTCVVSSGHICIVIGRSKIHGEIIDNARIILEIGKTLGLKSIANIPRQISSSHKAFNLSHANIKSENILVFEKI